MEGVFKSLIVDKDKTLSIFDKIYSEGEEVGIAMEGKSITKYPQRIKIFVHPKSNIGSFIEMSGYQKRGTW